MKWSWTGTTGGTTAFKGRQTGYGIWKTSAKAALYARLCASITEKGIYLSVVVRERQAEAEAEAEEDDLGGKNLERLKPKARTEEVGRKEWDQRRKDCGRGSLVVSMFDVGSNDAMEERRVRENHFNLANGKWITLRVRNERRAELPYGLRRPVLRHSRRTATLGVYYPMNREKGLGTGPQKLSEREPLGSPPERVDPFDTNMISPHQITPRRPACLSQKETERLASGLAGYYRTGLDSARIDKESPLGLVTHSAHPARFSPDDKHSRQRVLLKKRFGLLPTQSPPPKY
ncbi:hypothetical protein ACH5RR_040045 [Cinchona calisaya]|uniref:Nucleolar protein 10 n=1 Tax=Cinchona calisaya TaxID=153742 RepID=A0ABD2XV30_9GENT